MKDFIFALIKNMMIVKTFLTLIISCVGLAFALGWFNAYISPMFSIFIIMIFFDIGLCYALYNATYNKLQWISRMELDIKGAKSEIIYLHTIRNLLSASNNHCKDKMDEDKIIHTIEGGENKLTDFSGKLNAKVSKEFTYPVGVSIIILTAGIVAIAIIYVILFESNGLHSI